MTSLASTQSGNRPDSSTPMIRGQTRSKPWPAIATATSSPPAPVANIPTAPAIVVCESAPSSRSPGRTNRSRWM
jgi:hypothetical protein